MALAMALAMAMAMAKIAKRLMFWRRRKKGGEKEWQ